MTRDRRDEIAILTIKHSEEPPTDPVIPGQALATPPPAAPPLRRQIDGWIAKDGSHQHAIANLSDALAAERQAGRQEAVAIIAALAPERPMAQDEQGGCVWCGSGQIGDNLTNLVTHYPDCEWVAARRFLAETEGQQG